MIEFLEAVMMTVFSVGWVSSIAKMLRTGQASGKSLIFVVLVLFGYMCGAFSKLLIWHETNAMPLLLLLYLWNCLIVGFDAWLVATLNRRAENAAGVETGRFYPRAEM